MYDVVLITYHSRSHIAKTLASLACQTLSPEKVIVVENSGDRDMDDIVRRFFPSASFVLSNENIGFAEGMNTALQLSTAPFVWALNPDAIPDPDYAETIFRAMSDDPKAGMGQGLLWRNRGGQPHIDSLGHIRESSRSFLNLGEGTRLNSDAIEKLLAKYRSGLLGVTAGSGFYRRSALDEIESFSGESGPFSELLGTFLEDADIGLKLTHKGWKTVICTRTKCRHDRGSSYRWCHNTFADVKSLLQRNRYLVSIMNDSLADILIALPTIIAWEFIWLGASWRRPGTWIRAILDTVRALPEAFARRAPIQAPVVGFRFRHHLRRRRFPLSPLTEIARVDAVVAAYRNEETVNDACQSLLIDPSVSTVTLVDSDNGSSGPVEPRIGRVDLDENRGYAHAANRGADHGSSPVIAISNADTQVLDPLGPLLRHFATGDVAVVGPKLLSPDGSCQPSTHGFPTPLKVWGQSHPGLKRAAAPFLRAISAPGRGLGASFWKHDRIAEVDAVMGAFFLVRRDVWEELGGMDEGYFLWYEDADLCRRVRNMRYRIIFDPAVRVIHALGQSRRQNPDSDGHRQVSWKRYRDRHWCQAVTRLHRK